MGSLRKQGSNPLEGVTGVLRLPTYLRVGPSIRIAGSPSHGWVRVPYLGEQSGCTAVLGKGQTGSSGHKVAFTDS